MTVVAAIIKLWQRNNLPVSQPLYVQVPVGPWTSGTLDTGCWI